MVRSIKSGLKFELFKRWSIKTFRAQWYFRIRSANGEIVAQSEGYDTLAAAAATIRMLIAKTSTAEIVEQDDSDFYGS